MEAETSVATPAQVVRAPAPAVVRGEKRLTFKEHESDVKVVEIMARYLHRRIVDCGWIDIDRQSGPHVPGIVLKSDSKEEFVAEPSNVYPELSIICNKLGLTAVFTMSCPVADHVLRKLSPNQIEVTLEPSELTVPIVDSLHDLATTNTSVRRRDYICLVRKEQLVLVWSQSTDGLLVHAADVEDKLMGMAWGGTMPQRRSYYPGTAHGTPSLVSGGAPQDPFQSAPASVLGRGSEIGTMEKWKSGFNTPEIEDDEDRLSALDAEEQANAGPVKRPFILTHSFMTGLSACVLVVAQSANLRQVIVEVRALGAPAYDRLAMIATIPIFSFFSIFFFVVLVGAAFQLIGPVQDIKTGRSKFYSAIAPERRKHVNMEWPHITIQMPVYKEGLKGVIQPTINSVLPAIARYERIGGSANIFVCEDGMQLLKPEIAEMRKDFYQKHGIGWCSRPGHGKDGFVRGGRFKKASNMNYCLDFSLRVEDELLKLISERRAELGYAEDDYEHQLEIEEEQRLYDVAFEKIIEQDEGRTVAEGNVRMGDIILLIDCDTQVPVNCLEMAAMEMHDSPEVAIIQHSSGVLNVTNSWFENAITYFTNLIYISIKFSVGSGDVAPFVGHNAFIRWKALQSIRFTDKKTKRELFWSESHVSEDFDVALRLQTKGFLVRLATYHNGEFKEGVSLTVMDELLRWEKYAYGCSELLFNPLYQWIYKGPFTTMMYRLMGSNMKTTSKFTILGYMGTYFAIASALPLSLVNYFIIGWFNTDVDPIYMDSWKSWIGAFVIFQLGAPICFAIYRQRVSDKVFYLAYWDGIKWCWFFILYFGGLSWHLSYAILAHLFCLPIEWASTVKELESTGFFISLEGVVKTFKWSFIFNLCLIGGMVYLGQFANYYWSINNWLCIVPLASQVAGHMAMPLMSIVY